MTYASNTPRAIASWLSMTGAGGLNGRLLGLAGAVDVVEGGGKGVRSFVLSNAVGDEVGSTWSIVWYNRGRLRPKPRQKNINQSASVGSILSESEE